MSTTRIEWATHVWNPISGCNRVSDGCTNCYAANFARRHRAMGTRGYQRDGRPETAASPSRTSGAKRASAGPP